MHLLRALHATLALFAFEFPGVRQRQRLNLPITLPICHDYDSRNEAVKCLASAACDNDSSSNKTNNNDSRVHSQPVVGAPRASSLS